MSLPDVITILATGQSNCWGYGEGGSWEISPLVSAWNNGNDVMDLSMLGNAWVAPERDKPPFRSGSNNHAVQAANHLARLTGKQVRLILLAKNGQSIVQWHNGSIPGPMYARIQAVLDLAGVSRVDWFLWNQGSANNGNAATYSIKWDGLIAELTADGIIDASTPIVTNETGPMTPAINAALQAIADADQRCQMAKIGHFPTRDGVHFTGESLVRAGWEAVYSLAKTDTVFEGITPLQDLNDYVFATGGEAMTFPDATSTKVPLVARVGNLSMIDDGDFVALLGGNYRFSVNGYAAGGRLKMALVDGGGDFLATIGYSGGADAANNTPHLHGFTVLNIPPGGRVRLMVAQASGVTKSISEAHAAAYNRFEATYLG